MEGGLEQKRRRGRKKRLRQGKKQGVAEVIAPDTTMLLTVSALAVDEEIMLYKYNKKLVENAQSLRKNMTPEEKHLWYDFLKKLPITVNRQKNIGNYIVDFFISEKRVAIEIDGVQHQIDKNVISDEKRDNYLKDLGITVLRYKNSDINKNFNEVCNDILKNIGMKATDLTDRR